MTNLPEPRTRLEQYWAGILDKIEGGGNPNYVETVNGTIANPWGSYTLPELMQGVNDKSISIILTSIVEDVTLVYSPVAVKNNLLVCFCGVFSAYVAGSNVNLITQDSECIFYAVNGDFKSYGTLAAPTDYNEYSDSQTTLTIIHHPLPDTP